MAKKMASLGKKSLLAGNSKRSIIIYKNGQDTGKCGRRDWGDRILTHAGVGMMPCEGRLEPGARVNNGKKGG